MESKETYKRDLQKRPTKRDLQKWPIDCRDMNVAPEYAKKDLHTSIETKKETDKRQKRPTKETYRLLRQTLTRGPRHPRDVTHVRDHSFSVCVFVCVSEWESAWGSGWVSVWVEWVGDGVSEWVGEWVREWVSERVSEWASEWVRNIWLLHSNVMYSYV